MRLTSKQLKGLSVETQSGAHLGHVYDLILDTEGQHVVQYLVRASLLRGTHYLVGREQIVRFEATKMIVLDAVERQAEGILEKKSSFISPEPVVMRE